MKKQSKLSALPVDDQKRLLELCAQHTYDQVVALVAQPRDEGGLDLETNRSALSRFYLDHADIVKNSLLASQLFDITDAKVLPADNLLPK